MKEMDKIPSFTIDHNKLLRGMPLESALEKIIQKDKDVE